MCEALEELMADIIEERVNEQLEQRVNEQLEQRVNEQLEQVIQSFVDECAEDGKTQEVTISRLIKHFKLTEEKAKEYYYRFS